jgi:hypothetical protein
VVQEPPAGRSAAGPGPVPQVQSARFQGLALFFPQKKKPDLLWGCLFLLWGCLLLLRGRRGLELLLRRGLELRLRRGLELLLLRGLVPPMRHGGGPALPRVPPSSLRLCLRCLGDSLSQAKFSFVLRSEATVHRTYRLEGLLVALLEALLRPLLTSVRRKTQKKTQR